MASAQIAPSEPIAEGLSRLASGDLALQAEGRSIVQAHLAYATTPEVRAALAAALITFASATPLGMAAEVDAFGPGLAPWFDTLLTEINAALLADAEDAAQVAARREATRWAGHVAPAEEVPRLAALLGDADVWPEALNALLMTAEGVQAVIERLPTETSSDKQIEFIRALGQGQFLEARPALEALIPGLENRAVVWNVLEALARLGVPPTSVLQRPGNLTKEESARYAAAGLRAAQELLDHGQPKKAAPLFRTYADISGSWGQIQAALTGLNGTGVVEAVRSALGHLGNARLRAAAIRTLIESNAPGTDEMLDKAFKVGDPAMQSAILAVYAERGGEEGRKKIEAALVGGSAEQRVAAARLLGKAPGDADLVEIMTKGGPWARDEATNTFLQSANARLLSGEHAAAAEQFRALLQLRPSVSAEIAAIEGLGQCGEFVDQDAVAPFMGDPETGPAAYAATARLALKGSNREYIIEQLEILAEVSPHEEGVFAAAQGLAQLGLPEPKYNKQRGLLTEWLSIGPFPNEGNTAFGLAYLSESRADAIQLVTWLGKQYRWEKIAVDGYPATVEPRILYPDAQDSVVYLHSKFSMPSAAAAELHVGIGGAFELWLNGERVGGEAAARTLRLDDLQYTVALRSGTNKVLVKLIQSTEDWRCTVRVTDRRGRPLDLNAMRPAKDGSEGVGVSVGQAATTVLQQAP